MKFKDTFEMALSGLSVHKSRAALTILGIVIGIASITLVMAIGQSAQNLIIGEIQSFGPTSVFILPGRQPTSPTGFGLTILVDSIKEKDIRDLSKKSNVPDAVSVTPIVFGPATISHGSEVYNSMVLGSTPETIKIYNLKIEEGNIFTNEDILQKSDVALIGKKVVEKLFGESSALGQRIKIKEKNFRVIGIISPKGQTPFVNFDEVVLTPYTSAQQYILGIRHIQRVVVEASSVEAIPGVIRDIESVLRGNHNISDPEKDDFYVQTQEDVVRSVSTITDILTVLLTSVAAISLLVGGIGIMNIMLVSVTERTKEIGLRKALGATNADILVQFLTEAVLLTLAGGVIGILLGTLLSLFSTYVANEFFELGFTFVFPMMGIFLGVLVSTVIGFTFGIFPARQASKKSPMDALRYE